ncbi:Imidazole glycerol phosphate synthase cyclase subunit HisF [hydrothermal vent metagenome]|uniref:imidazole glycerol-phosphate synthase n=1 Tax=hydrothermal vent metagenome TaxID=652676 RepID=A0A3B0RST0_9ZZZZ
MLARRIIPCLDVKDGQVVKGIQFAEHKVVGDIVALARRYARAGADELVFYDITASPQNRRVDAGWVSKVARELDIPFTVAGGIGSVADAAQILGAGADKISVNSPALQNPDLIEQLAKRFGSQCVVIGIDSFWDGNNWQVKALSGDPDTMISTNWTTRDWLVEVQLRGAGEIVLNCMNEDGRRAGYDIKQLAEMRSHCSIPLIASGGAGCVQDFAQVFQHANVDGALAASVFHQQIISISVLKSYLRQQQIEVRL